MPESRGHAHVGGGGGKGGALFEIGESVHVDGRSRSSHVGGTQQLGQHCAAAWPARRPTPRTRDQKQRPETHRNRAFSTDESTEACDLESRSAQAPCRGSDGGFQVVAGETNAIESSSACGVICSSAARSGGGRESSSQRCWEPHAGRSESAQGPGQDARPDARRLPPPPAKLPKVR